MDKCNKTRECNYYGNFCNYRFLVSIVFSIFSLFFIFILNIQQVSAVCCQNACYESGVCYGDAGGVWYQGCKDNVGKVYPPNGTISDCMLCVCNEADKTKCEWQASDNLCNANDPDKDDVFCKDLGALPPGIGTSKCLNRDDKEYGQELCSATRCEKPFAYWVTHGEPLKTADPNNWDYLPTDYNNKISGCCGDDDEEYYNITTIDGIQYSACCDKPKDCVDAQGLCQSEAGKEISCFKEDGTPENYDNDCDGLIDSNDPDCCPNADFNEPCCTQNNGAFSNKAKTCCGDSPADYGQVKDGVLCYLNSKNNKPIWIDNDFSDGIIFTIKDPEDKTFDVLKSDIAPTGFYNCNTDNGKTLGADEILDMEMGESSFPDKAATHSYLCYTKIEGGKTSEIFAECSGYDDYYSADTYGGERYLEGDKITVKQITTEEQDTTEVSKYCCTEDAATKGWAADLDTKSCVQGLTIGEQTACNIAGFKANYSGEDNPENPIIFPKKGTPDSLMCCGDDTAAGFEYYIETTITANKYSACCDKQTDCVDDKGFCRNESVGGEKTCDDNIDNDCDGLIDQGQVSGYAADPDCCGDGDQFKTCCELKKGTWFDDSSGNTFCCGDDTPEYVVNSTEDYRTSSYPIGPNKGTYSCCPDKDDCVYDGKCHTSAKDGAKENANNGCYDGKDNDCDSPNGLSDFSEVYIDDTGLPVTVVAEEDKFRASTNLQNEDDDCTLTVTGKIVGEGDEDDPVGGAHIIMQGSFNSPYLTGGVPRQPKMTYETDSLSPDDQEALANPDKAGTFKIVGVNGDSSYDITITHPDYESKTRHVEVGYGEEVIPTIKIGPDHDTCNSDCTNIGNDLCNKECDAVFGSTPHPNCLFYGQSKDIDARQRVAQLCNQKVSGQLVNYTYEKDKDGNSLFVECCKGSPESFKPTTAKISAGFRQDLIRTTRIITYRGKPVKMIIDAFG